MTKGTLLRNNTLLGAMALTVLFAVAVFAHLQGGLWMNLGEMQLSVQSHTEGGLIVQFVRAP